MGFRVHGLCFRDCFLGVRVYGSCVRVLVALLAAQSSGFRIEC